MTSSQGRNRTLSGQRGEKIVANICEKFGIPFVRCKMKRANGRSGKSDGYAKNASGKAYCFEVITCGGAHDGLKPCICGENPCPQTSRDKQYYDGGSVDRKLHSFAREVEHGYLEDKCMIIVLVVPFEINQEKSQSKGWRNVEKDMKSLQSIVEVANKTAEKAGYPSRMLACYHWELANVLHNCGFSEQK